MANAPAPSMTASGWIDDVVDKADTLLAYAYEAEQSQPSSMSIDAVCSLSWIFHTYGHDEVDLCMQLQLRLERYLKPYFDAVEVTATVKNTPEQELTGRTNIALGITVTDAGKDYTIGSLIEAADNKVVNLIKINNGT